MKTFDQLHAEMQRRDLFISSLTERLAPNLEWEALCYLKRRDGAGWGLGRAPTINGAIESALATFGVERKPKPPAEDFEDLL